MKKLILIAMLFAHPTLAFAEEAETVAKRSPFALPSGLWLLLILAALLVAFIVVGSMKGKLKTAAKKDSAGNYIREGSLKLEVNHDYFLYKTETRRKIEQKKESYDGH